MGCDCATARLLVVADTAGPDAPKRGWGGEQGRQIKRLPRLTNPRARTTRRAGLLLLLLLALTIKWQFEGGESGSALARRRGEQRAYEGDAVFDEMLGEAKLVGRGSSNAFLRIEVDSLGDKEVPRLYSVQRYSTLRGVLTPG